MFNGAVSKKEELKGHSVRKMKIIEVIMPGPKTTALFGTSGRNGVIYVDQKKIDLDMLK